MTTEGVRAEIARSGRTGQRIREIAESVGVSQRTAQREVGRLTDLGVVEYLARGVVRTRRQLAESDAPLRNATGRRIWLVLTQARLPAYVSGLDVIGGRAHQAIVSFPHLVVCDPVALDECDWQLASTGFDLRARSGRLPMLGDPDRTILVRGGRGVGSPAYGIQDRVAPEQLAWLDLYREARNGRYPIGPTEMGQMLAAILPDPTGTSRLRTLARRHAFMDVLTILDGGTPEQPYASTVALAARA